MRACEETTVHEKKKSDLYPSRSWQKLSMIKYFSIVTSPSLVLGVTITLATKDSKVSIHLYLENLPVTWVLT